MGSTRKDIQCPYCGDGQNINHDDGYGYEEDTYHQQQCHDCERYFIFTTSILYLYDVKKAECLNDGNHDFQKIVGYPERYFINKFRCSICGEEKEGNE